MKPKTASPPDFDTIYTNVLTQMGGPVEVETPQLGRVAYPRPAELYTALNLLRQEAARAAGVSTTGVFTVGYRRGLGPSKGDCL